MERRPLMSLLIGLTLCVSLWQIMLQQQSQNFDPVPSIDLVNDTTNSPLHFATSNTTIYSLPRSQLQRMPKNDFSLLIDLEDFEFLLNHQACKELEHQPIIVVIIHSAPDNFHKRQVIRQTWATSDPRALFIFLIGAVNATNLNLQDKINLENKAHGDLVQGNFEDAYRNMTYKHVMALKWFVYKCPDAHFLLKTDDDVFVNTPFIYNYLENPLAFRQNFPTERLLFCYEISRAKVKRTFRSKWRVSYDEYVESYFPNHCPGFSILYSTDVVRELYLKAQKLPYFWIDDVHITGNVATKLNIAITPANNFYLTNDLQRKLLNGIISVANVPFFFAQPNLEEAEIKELWKLIKNAETNTNVSSVHSSSNGREIKNDLV